MTLHYSTQKYTKTFILKQLFCPAKMFYYNYCISFNTGCRKNTLIPLFIKFLEEAVGRRKRNVLDEKENKHELIDEMRVHAAELIGRLCYDLKGFFSYSYYYNEFYECYLSMHVTHSN